MNIENIGKEFDGHYQKMEWLPIETAPKDGTQILVCDNSDVFKVYFDKPCNCWWEVTTGYNEGADPIEFKYWMPLPELPEKKHE